MVLQVRNKETYEPGRDLEKKKNSDTDVVVHQVERFGPVGEKSDYSLRRITLVCVLQDKVNKRNEGVGAGVTRKGILVRREVLLHIVEAAPDTTGSLQKV